MAMRRSYCDEPSYKEKCGARTLSQFPIQAIVSIDIATTDLVAHGDFFANVWGLEKVDHESNALFFAGTGADPYILSLIPADKNGLVAVTFRCASRAAMDEIAAKAKATGCSIEPSSNAKHRPGGGTSIDICEPNGCTIRLVHGDEQRTPKPMQRDRIERLSHVNINTRDVDGLAQFYGDVLGMALSDRSKMMAFLRCNSDHHAVVLADAPVEGLNHIAFLLPELEGVMLASGRMRDHGFEMGWGVGRHGPGNNVFSYFVDPFGYVVEYTADILQIDETYRVGQPSDWKWPAGRTDHWGIAPPKSDACKAAQITIGFASSI